MVKPDYKGLIGIPFKYGGRGPDFYDCYGLVMELHQRRGIELPDYESPDDFKTIHKLITKEITLWEPCDMEIGCTILIGGSRLNHHVATYLGFGKLIHTHQGIGSVVVEKLRAWETSIAGCYRFKE